MPAVRYDIGEGKNYRLCSRYAPVVSTSVWGTVQVGDNGFGLRLGFRRHAGHRVGQIDHPVPQINARQHGGQHTAFRHHAGHHHPGSARAAASRTFGIEKDE